MGFPEKLVGSLESSVGSHEAFVTKGFPYSYRLPGQNLAGVKIMFS